MSPMILRSITVNKEQAAVARVAFAALGERPDVLSPEGREVLVQLVEKAEAVLVSIARAEDLALANQQEIAARAGESVPDPTSVIQPGQATVWTYRSSSWYGTKDEAERAIIREAEAAVPAEQATITLLAWRQTPTGRWSAMVKRERIDPA